MSPRPSLSAPFGERTRPSRPQTALVSRGVVVEGGVQHRARQALRAAERLSRVVVEGVLILWLGWFGFNAGSTLGTEGSRLAEIAFVTNLAAASGAVGAAAMVALTPRSLDVSMIGNGVIAALVAITAPSGFVEFWAAPIIGVVAGLLVVPAVRAIDRVLGVQAAGVVAAFVAVFGLSYLTFAAIKAVLGLRVTDQEEQDGLDIVEHGMYGYPEQFIEEQAAGGDLGGEPPTALPGRV